MPVRAGAVGQERGSTHIERIAPYGGGTDGDGKMPPLDPIAEDTMVRPPCDRAQPPLPTRTAHAVLFGQSALWRWIAFGAAWHEAG